MLKIKIYKSFKKDIARDKSSGHYSKNDFKILKSIIISLQNSEQLHSKFKRHPLKGKLEKFESVHLKNDWLLIFKIDREYLNLVILGKHTQVYKKFN